MSAGACFAPSVRSFAAPPDPGPAPAQEAALLNPFEMLADHPDLSLCITRLPDGERGRWYPDRHVIVLDDRLTQSERRCTLTHELVHRLRGDCHVSDHTASNRQEIACHLEVARMLIPFASLRAAMQWGRTPEEIAEELWVDVETLSARVMGLSPLESEAILDFTDNDEAWSVA